MKRTVTSVLVLLVLVSLSLGQGVRSSSVRVQDTSCPIAVKYVGTGTNALTLSAGWLFTVVADGRSSSTQLVAGSTVSTIVGFLNNVTNASGINQFVAVPWEALTTDTVSNNLILLTNAVIGAAFDVTTIKWDTSACLHFDVVPDITTPSGIPQGGFTLDGVWGNPTGTGNVTLDVYANDTLMYERTITSPVYVTPQYNNGSNVTTNTTDAFVSLSSGSNPFPSIHIGLGKKCLVRASRATTATTGVIGASINNQ